MQPPCVVPGSRLNECAGRLYREKVLGHVDLSADWAGWKLRGAWLVSPDGQRINPLRLRGLLFREAGESRVPRAKQRESGFQGAVVDFRETAREALAKASED